MINRFRILNKFPEIEENKDEIVKTLHIFLEPSESDEMTKVHDEIEHLESYKNDITATL